MKKKIPSTRLFRIEWICIKIFGQLLHRNVRYLPVVLPMYFRSVYNARKCHILRASYCFARYLDDILDGDIRIQGDPTKFIEHLMSKIRNTGGTSSDNSDYVILGKYVYQNIDQYTTNGVVPSRELDILIEAMLFDRERADRRMLLSRAELDNHHLQTFRSALLVTLNITGAQYRPEEVETLARAQGSFYSLRDLEKDLSMFINNIPEGILLQSKLDDRGYWNYPELIQSAFIIDWINEEYNQGLVQLTRLRKVLAENRDFHFRATIKPLYKGLSYLRQKLMRQHNIL